MLPVMFQNSWMPTLFDDFLNTDFMPRAKSTAPAVNVKESEKAYTMELAAPGIKKASLSRIRLNIKRKISIITICVASSATLTMNKPTHCLMMWNATRSLLKSRMVS